MVQRKFRYMQRKPQYVQRKFQYVQPIDNSSEPMTITVSEEWIQKMYFPYWWKTMIKHNRRIDERFAFNDCIDDFCIVNWAHEL